MKSINITAVAAVLALSSASIASATVYHVTGSTAFRAADVSAEVAIVGTSGKATYYGDSLNTSPNLNNSNYSVVESSDGTIVFENYFNGSIGGIQALVDGVTTLPFPNAATHAPTGPLTLASTVAPFAAVTGGTNAGLVTNNSTLAPFQADVDQATADIAFSDVSFATAKQAILASADHTITNPTYTSPTPIGIVPFVFVCDGSSDVTDLGTSGVGVTPVLSMDPQKFTYTWSSGGSATLNMFTGIPGDVGVSVYPLGRDIDSGTRATALAETGYGLKGSSVITTPVVQFYPYNSISSDTTQTTDVIGISTAANPLVEQVAVVPNETLDGYTMNNGNGGYYSGKNLYPGVSTQFDSANISATVFVAYLGTGDAKSALTNTATNCQKATLMAYNGAVFYPTQNFPTTGLITSNAANAAQITEGKYTFWGYEYEFARGNTTFTTMASNLYTQVHGTSTVQGLDVVASNGVAIQSMHVGRPSGDGQNIQ